MIAARLFALAAAALAGLALSGPGWAQAVSCPAFVLSDPVIAQYDPEDISCSCDGVDLEVSTPDRGRGVPRGGLDLLGRRRRRG